MSTKSLLESIDTFLEAAKTGRPVYITDVSGLLDGIWMRSRSDWHCAPRTSPSPGSSRFSCRGLTALARISQRSSVVTWKRESITSFPPTEEGR